LKILPSANGDDEEDPQGDKDGLESKVGSKDGVKTGRRDGEGSSSSGSSDDDDEEEDDGGSTRASGPRVYKMLSHVPRDTRKDALRFRKSEKKKLPRVTAYCTAR